MLILIPIILLLLAAAAILILYRLRPNLGYPWFIADGISFLIWVFCVVLYWLKDITLTFPYWGLVDGDQLEISFQLNLATWPLFLSLASLLFAVSISATIRRTSSSESWTLAANLVLGSFGLLTVLSGNPISFIFTWSLIDLIEFLILSRLVKGNINRRLVRVFILRILGTLMLVWAMVVSRSKGVGLSFDLVLPEASVFILIAVLLRLDILSPRVPFETELEEHLEMGIIIRLVGAVSSFSIFSRLSPLVLPSQWETLLIALSGIASGYGAVMWLAAQDEKKGQPYLLIGLMGLAFSSMVRGQPSAAMSWGIALILSGGLILLHSLKWRGFLVLPFLGFIGLTGLPFTPSAGGWQGLRLFPISLWNLVFLLSHGLLLVGYLKHAMRIEAQEDQSERWFYVIYPFGLGQLVAVHWFVTIMGKEEFFAIGNWLLPLISTVLAVLSFILFFIRKERLPLEGARIRLETAVSKRFGAFFEGLLGLEWLANFILVIYRLIQQIVRFSTDILEGDGGVLWAFLLLTLLVSLIVSGGVL